MRAASGKRTKLASQSRRIGALAALHRSQPPVWQRVTLEEQTKFNKLLVGDRLGERWKQQVVVENRIGAGGRIGAEAVHRSAPDGYTLLLFSNTHAINQALYKDHGYDLLRDFAPLGLTPPRRWCWR